MMENSSWEFAKKSSQYHFDTALFDPRWDQLQGLGRFEGDWSKELAEVLETAEPATWRTRLNNRRHTLSPMIAQEEQDLINANCDPNITLLRMLHEDRIPKKFLDMAAMIGIGMSKIRVHVQHPGEVFTQHIDKLAAFSWRPKDASAQTIKRVVVFLTDWLRDTSISSATTVSKGGEPETYIPLTGLMFHTVLPMQGILQE